MSENKNKKENPLVNILFNIVLPSVILSKFSKEEYLGTVNGLLVALAFPLAYGIYDLYKMKKYNFFSILGFVSILLTGGLGLLQVDGFWFAVKEAAIPALLGIFVLASLKTSKPLVKVLLYNENFISVDTVNEHLEKNNTAKNFNRLLTQTTMLLSFAFFVSAVLNFGLAVYVLKSPAGTPEFNEELGKMTALSYPVITLPSMVILGFVLWRLIHGIKKMTGLELEQIFKAQ